MNNQIIKYTSIFTLLIFSIYVFASLIPNPVIVENANASTITQDELYKGLGIAILLIILSKLGKAFQKSDPDQGPPSSEQLELLARVIHAEARGEPLQGQIAVGAVVLNRLSDPEFPDNVYDIIHEAKQFSSVNDGQILLEPNQTAFEAAKEALNGNDPSMGALYFYNPKTARFQDWFEQNTIETITIGNHKFCRAK